MFNLKFKRKREMKKFFITLVAVLGLVISSQAAETLTPSKFFDNWSLGLKGGAVTPLNHGAFWGDMRGVTGIEVKKAITPTLSVGVEGEWSVNTSGWDRFPHSTTAFDHQLIGGFTTLNLMNAFGGFSGSRRVFEIEIQGGIGWLHAYMNDHKMYDNYQVNSWYTKFGPNFNFNLGKAKAWTISLRPEFVYNMGAYGVTGYNINHGYFEILAGVTYNFKNSNGTHYFTTCPYRYTQEDWDYLLAAAESYKAIAMQKPKVVETVVEVKKVVEVPVIKTEIINAIGFELNSSEISPLEYASLENISKWMKENPEEKITVVGYADKDTGTPGYNDVLSLRRAEAVKDVLVNNFGINESRLVVLGKGSINGQPFSENNWNRVVVFKTNK